MNLFAASGPNWWTALGWTMLHVAWAGCAVWLLAAVALFVVRRAAPSVRYAVALAWLVVLSGLPIGLFAWQVQRLPPRPTTVSTIAPSLTPKSPANPPRDLRVSTPPTVLIPVRPIDARTPQEPAAFKPADPIPPQRAVLDPRAILLELTRRLDGACRYLPWLWIAGSALVSALWITGLAGTERLRLTSRRLESGELIEACGRLAALLGVARRVGVAISDRVGSPVVLGIVRPLILLPPAAVTGLTGEQLEMVLLHELAHVRRWDNLVNLWQRVVESLLFFHPAVWWLSRRVRLEREHCCDRVVIGRLGRPQAYAETLASLAIPGLPPAHAVAAMAHHHLVSRIRHILDLEDRSMTVSRKFLSGLTLLVVCGGLIVAAWAQQPVGGPSGPQTGGTQPPAQVLEVQIGPTSQPPGYYDRQLQQPGAREYSIVAGDGLRTVYAYVESTKRNWGPEQATGAPDTPQAGDQVTAWASQTMDSQDEWLELTYDPPVEAAAALIHESYCPGAVNQIIACDESGNVTSEWKGKDPTPAGRERGVSVIPLTANARIKTMRVFLQSTAVPGWNEIDAVGLIDTQGNTHWATGATASSTYADAQSASADILVAKSAESPESRIQRLEAEVQALRLSLEELRNEVRGRGIPGFAVPYGPSSGGFAPGAGTPGLPPGYGAPDVGSPYLIPPGSVDPNLPGATPFNPEATPVDPNAPQTPGAQPGAGAPFQLIPNFNPAVEPGASTVPQP